jgi:hypothetical protein
MTQQLRSPPLPPLGGDTPLIALDAAAIADAARRRSAERFTIRPKTGPIEHGLVLAASVNRRLSRWLGACCYARRVLKIRSM